MISVLLADDQAMVRAGFRLILSAEPDITVAGEAADGVQAVAVLDDRQALDAARAQALQGVERRQRRAAPARGVGGSESRLVDVGRRAGAQRAQPPARGAGR